MPVTRLSDRVVPLLQEALERHCQGEEIEWDYSFIQIPQQGTMMQMTLWLKGMVLDTTFLFCFAFTPKLSDEQLDVTMHDALTQAFKLRTEALNAAMPSNGHIEIPSTVEGLPPNFRLDG